MEYRQANCNDLDAFTAFRIEFLALIREIHGAGEFEERTRRYLNEHIGQDDLVIFIAEDEGKIVSSCMACIFETVPLVSCPNGKAAELLNVYTLNKYRRNGHAEALLNLLFQELRSRGVEKVILDYTEDGLPLYEKLGFSPLLRQMELRL